MAIQLLVTNDALAVQGDPLTGWTSLDAVKKFNEPGAGSVTLPAYPEVMNQLVPGNRIVVIRDGSIWMAGPMEIPTDYSWTADGGDRDPGEVTVNFSDDLATIAGYITWPEPSLTWADQHGNTYRTFVGINSETMIRTLINENCGPGAITARRIPNLVLDTAAGVGGVGAAKTRFEPLLDICRRLTVWGNIGFRTRQDGNQIKFGCYAPADKSATARFSVGLGNLRSIQYKASAPSVTHALVAGNETEGSTVRTFVEVANTAAAAEWWRVEKYIDGGADNDTNGELTAAGNTDLADGSAPVELATVTVDTEDLQAGRDYDLGDRVAIALPHGLQVTDVVRSIHLQATPDAGETVSSVVGSPDATTDPQMVRLIRTLSRKLGRLETR
ncbi:siphovirus ReqiPepy6 Gp37-like family protein [Streptomyces sp. NBC_00444]|uniref:siphovirus ReqiPepy6 Gp37-like family protein n=1 Tax=Streptomyces sp. NBC_00444 TaxID=2975744 RepID=UPI002E21240F